MPDQLPERVNAFLTAWAAYWPDNSVNGAAFEALCAAERVLTEADHDVLKWLDFLLDALTTFAEGAAR